MPKRSLEKLVHHLMLLALIAAGSASGEEACRIELVVLGTGQDAGAPQIGNREDPAWSDSSLGLTATSIALVDHVGGKRFLFEATPHITDQLQLLDSLAPVESAGLGVDGVLLTHAHIGHYTGLMFFGREAAGAKNVPVYAMPRFREYLENNGPWSQLVSFENIALVELADRESRRISEGIEVTPHRVPHRDEYSETVGFLIEIPSARIFFLPDIDSWGEWVRDYDVRIEDIVQSVDYAFLDATFFDNNELPGRDMSLIPHPRVKQTMDRLGELPDDVRRRVHFIHYNHTNPIRFPASAESAEVRKRGFNIARAGDRHCLSR
ncbi:MAG: MBL fold metallo-hydrolase [Woeseiaceae bacterium]|nr:MBL fold metallo-hydrolase [Woeseiaceae bacterium]